MHPRRYRGLGILCLVLAGSAVGAGSGYLLGRRILLRQASASVTGYSADLLQHAEEYSSEVENVFARIRNDKLPFCSAEDITLLRDLTFRSLGLRDIGRLRNGTLYCSALLGVLPNPKAATPPTIAMPGNVSVHIGVPLLLAQNESGTVISTDFANVVMSPNSFEHWDRPGMRYMVVVYNGDPVQMAVIAGQRIPRNTAWIIAQKSGTVAGMITASRCSKRFNLCAVADQKESSAVASPRSLLPTYTLLGTLAGSSFGLAVGQFYHRRKSLPQQLRRALRRDALNLVYQPIVDLNTREWAGAEALARWNDEHGSPVPADVFVRLAEEGGMSGDLSSFVIRRATQELHALLTENPGFSLSINIAASDFAGNALFDLLDVHVRQAGILPGQIALELTERSTADPEIAQPAIRRLRSLGYRMHIDDFGTGFSSLSYLHELSVDAIKVDRAFTNTIGTEAVTASVLPLILDMAVSLRAQVIVEGIETEAQIHYLAARGEPLLAQGWYFGKPVPAATLCELAARNGANRTWESVPQELETQPS